MARRLRGQWVNVALVVGALCLVGVVIATTGKVTTSEREARENNVLPAFREGELTRIAVEGPKGWVLERVGEGDAGDSSWWLKQPVKEEADVYAVDKLLGSLEFARVVRRVDPGEVDRARFGLESPSWTMTLQMGDIRYRLRLGGEAASPKGAHYLELEAEGAPGSGVMIVGRDLLAELRIGASELRGRQLMPYFSSALERIVIEGPGGVRRLKSAGDKRWRFDGMLNDVRLDRELFDQVLVQFARTKAEHFITVDEAAGALGKDPLRVTLFPKGAAPKGVVELGGACPKSENGVAAVRRAPDPVGACVPESVLPALQTPAEKLVDRGLFLARRDEVESLRLQYEGRELVLHRKESGFAMEKPEKADVPLEAGDRYLDALLSAEGTLAAPETAAKTFGKAQGLIDLTVLVEGETNVQHEVVEIGERDAEGRLALRRKDDGAVLLLDREAGRAVSTSAVQLRGAEVMDFPVSRFQSAEVTALGVTQRFVREPSGQFRLEEPRGFEHDAAALVDLVEQLGTLRAERWVADVDDGTFGLAAPQARVRFTVATEDGGTQTHELIVGALVSGGAYAKLKEKSGIFVVPRRLVDALQSLLIDRSVMMVAPEVAERIVLERDGKQITLVRQGNTYVTSPPGQLDATAVTRVVEALGNLRAETALHLGAAKPVEGMAKPELVVHVDPPGGGKQRTIRIGSGDAHRGISVHYARLDGVNATYVIAKSRVDPLLGAL